MRIVRREEGRSWRRTSAIKLAREGARSNQYIAPMELSFFDTCQIHRHSLASLGLPNIPAMNLQSPHSGGTARGRELCHAATADTAF